MTTDPTPPRPRPTPDEREAAAAAQMAVELRRLARCFLALDRTLRAEARRQTKAKGVAR